jgi:hypothetical protein
MLPHPSPQTPRELFEDLCFHLTPRLGFLCWRRNPHASTWRWPSPDCPVPAHSGSGSVALLGKSFAPSAVQPRTAASLPRVWRHATAASLLCGRRLRRLDSSI